MPRLFLFSIVFALPFLSISQTPEHQKCGHQYAIKQHALKTPGYFEEVQNYIQNVLPQISQNATPRDFPVIIQIPVVIHVIHFGESIGTGRNISNERINSQIEILNNDFRRMNADASQTPSQFQPFAADVEIEFCLAKTDPFGNPTSGITRHQYGTISSISYIENEIKPATNWNPNFYLNIWSMSLPSNDLLGYSFLPTQTMVGTDADGVVINYLHFGYIDTTNRGRTAVHEIGHYLGLLHTWGSDDSNGNPIGCTSDDGINDTPNTSGPYFGCPSQGFSCSSSDMFMNFMDYTDDYCMNLFTNGQKNVMQNILTGIRSNLSNNGSTQCQTNCLDIATSSFEMGFENNESTNGWQTENTNNDNTSWQFALETGNDWGPNNGEGMAIYFWNQDGVTSANDYLFTPCFQIKDDHAYRLSFTFACAKSDNVVYSERLEIGFSENQNSNDFYTIGSNWTIDPVNNAYPDYNSITLNFQSNANSTISVGFHVFSDADKYALQIDDVKIEDLGSISSAKVIENGSAISVSPNPTTGSFAVKIDLAQPEKMLELNVYDMLGRLVETRQLNDVAAEIINFDLSDKEPGMYFLDVKGENIRSNQKILLSK